MQESFHIRYIIAAAVTIRASSGSAAADKSAVKILISRAVIMTLQPRLNQLKKLGILGGLTGL